MSERVIQLVVGLLLLAVIPAYAYTLRLEFLKRVHSARRSAARLTRDRAVELVRHHASVAPPNYRTMYENMAARLEEMPLE